MMAYPFLNQHSEKQYLKLEEIFMNLHSFLISLQTHTEGEDLNKDSLRLIHFKALCQRISDGIEMFEKDYQRVKDARFKGIPQLQPHTTPCPLVMINLLMRSK